MGKLTGKLRHETCRATDRGRRPLLSTELTAVVAAVIAATASVSAVFLNQHGTIGLENRKFEQMQRDDAQKNRRLALAELAKEMAADVQRATLFSWEMVNDPEGITPSTIAAYQNGSDAALPKLFSAQILLAANDRATYEMIAPLILEYHLIDDCLSKALIDFRREKRRGLAAVAKCQAQALALQNSMPEIFAAAASLYQGPRVAER